MNRLIVAFALLLCATSLLYAQQPEEEGHSPVLHFKKGALEARINEFFTTELGLTPEEADAFIPLYKEFRHRVIEIRKDCRKRSEQLKRQKQPVQEDCLQMIDECLQADIRAAETAKEYYEQFKKVVPPEKLYRFREVERNFVRSFSPPTAPK